MTESKPTRVLVVEDDSDHRLLISLAFERHDPNAALHMTTRATDAVAYLIEIRERLLFGDADIAVPDVIVLDLSMPGMSGQDFLRWTANQSDWVQHVPVIVFTSSDDPELARECFSLGAREFKEKPADFGELVALTRRVIQKWSPKHSDMG